MENKKKKTGVSKKRTVEQAPAKKQSAPKRTAPSGGQKKSSARNEKSILANVIARIVLTLSKYAGKIVTYALNIVLTVLLIGIITGSAVACALVVYIKNYVDPYYDIEDLKTDSSLTTFVYYQQTKEDGSTDWVEWEEERIHGTENRMWVSYEEMPEDLINAFVSIEDKRFFTHEGIDVRRTTGAVLGFLTGNDSYGGSTITQQLIKNVSGEDDVTIQRKIQEILRALNLEGKRSKEEILEMYLNTIYLSKGCYGVSAAAYEFFGKEVSELTLVECAALASIPQNPSKWDPVNHPDLNKERRDIVLNQMYENTDIEKTYTIEEIRAAKAEELVLAKGAADQNISTVHSWFVDTLISDVIRDLMETYNYDEQTAKNLLYSGGLRIYSTIDRNIQAKLDAVYQNDAMFPSHGTGVQVESAMTIIEQSTGNLVAIVGGRGVKTTPLGFNRATQAERQPGSSIKPLASYSIGIEKGLINYSTVLDDTPFETDPSGKTWPNNWNFVYDGLFPVCNAVRDSKNTTAVKVVDLIGPRTAYEFLVNKYRLSSLVEADADYAPLGLGGFTYGVYNRDMAAAYAAIANGGVYNEPKTYTKVLDSVGNVILDNASATQEVILSEDTCAVMTRLMQEVVTSGTGTALTLRRQIDCAGKTGTTQNDNDAYFCGYTPYYTAACWVGYDIPRSLSGFKEGQTRVTPALYLWDQVMTAVHQDIIAAGNLKSFANDLTKNLITRSYCRDSGLLAGPLCKSDPRGSRVATGFYTTTNMPTRTCDRHVSVTYCSDTNRVAGPKCENTKQVVLVNWRREFLTNVRVTDTQYTYQTMPEGRTYATNPWDSFFITNYEPGKYGGFTQTTNSFNSFCAEHNPELCGY